MYGVDMPRLDETDPKLILSLRLLMDEYGAKGVYDTCAQLINWGTKTHTVTAVVDEPMKTMVQITGDDDYDEPHAYPENADAAQRAYDTLRVVNGDGEIVAVHDDTPAPGSTLGLVSDAPDATPTQWPPVTVHNDPPDLRDPDAWDNWKHAHGVAHGDPNNVGPMGNR